MQQNGELSVEEILESIKKVIARDNKETAQVERYRRETEGVVLRRSGTNFGLTPMTATGPISESGLVPETGNDDELDEGDEDDGDQVLDLSEVLGDEEGGGDEPSDNASDTPQDADEYTAEDPAMELIEPQPNEYLVEDAAEPESDQLPEAPLGIKTTVEEMAAPMVRHSLDALTATPADAETLTQSGETPLERMVRESLQPILREWLDANLEPMVERMVKAELERVMGKLS